MSSMSGSSDGGDDSDGDDLRDVLGMSPRRAPAVLAIGQVIDDTYRIDAEIGAGGMGRVYRAHDLELDRDVALKLHAIALGPDDDSLRREALALARLSHPNVVTVHAVGTWQGHPWVAMEHVAGGTARTWCAGKRPHEILALYAAAGDGLAAAHAAGIVHRDFKPDNILVGQDGRPRVADFGLARGRTDDAEEERVVGTPAYMAPEQRAGARVDERADQYAFAAALWEALSGERVASPAVPTHTSANGEQASVALSERGAARAMPTHVAVALRRALELDPAHRWPSVADLVAELRKDPRARARRIGIAALAVVAVGGAITVPLLARSRDPEPCGGGEVRIAEVWNAERAAAIEKALGAHVTAIVRPRLDDYARSWVEAERRTCRAGRVERTLTEVQLGQQMVCLQRARARFAAIVQGVTAGGRDTIEQITDELKLLPDLASCSDVAVLARQQPPPADPEVHAKLDDLVFELAVADVAALRGRPVEVREADALLARARGVGWPPVIAEAQYTRAGALDMRGRHDDAQAAYRAAANAGIAAGHHEIAAYALADLAWALATAGRSTEAARETALAESLRSPSTDAYFGARLLGAKRLIAQAEGRGADALGLAFEQVKLARAAFGDPLNEAINHSTLASSHMSAGDHAAAVREAELALRQTEEAVGADHPAIIGILRTLGPAKVLLGRVDEADRDILRALALAERWHGPESVQVGQALIDRITVAAARGDAETMHALAMRALPIFERANQSSEPYGGLLLDLGVAAAQRGELDEAGRYAARALAVLEGLGNADNPVIASVLILGSYVARERGSLAESEALLRRAVGISERRGTLGLATNVKLELSYTLVKANRARDAVELLAPLSDAPPLEPHYAAELHQARADALWSAGDKAAARTEAQAALAAWTALGEPFAGQRAHTADWLAKHR